MAKIIENKTILPEPTIRRLPWYLSYVRMLNNLHVEYVSATQISKELNVQSSQIAKDLSFLNIRGKTRIGYEIPFTREFYRYTPLKPSSEIFQTLKELEQKESELMERLLH